MGRSHTKMIKRLFDIVLSLISIIIFLIPFLVISFVIKVTSPGPTIYWSKRSGQHGKLFLMPKFRTMKVDTPEIETNKLLFTKKYITRFGSFLRKTSLDEIPQFITILKGDMTLIGPRPALHNQNDLIKERKKLGIDFLKPGITGWAQVNGRDTLEMNEKIQLDYFYLQNQSIFFDLKILLITICVVLKFKNVSH